MNYRNLDLEAFDYQVVDSAERFRVRVARSPVGEQRLSDAEEVTLPPEFRRRLRWLERRRLGLAEMITLGEELAASLFPPQTRQFLIRSRERLDAGEGLRIRLKLDTYALADLPWEYLYLSQPEVPPDQRGPEGFLSLDRRMSLVRYEVLGRAPGSLEPVGTGSLRMVTLLANPDDPAYDELRLDDEQRNIEQALARASGIEADFYPDATITKLEDALTREAHVFHFAGHGQFVGDLGTAYGSLEGTGFIVLLDDERRPVLFPAERLALNLAGRGVRLAVLGACEAGRRDQVNAWTGVAPALTQAGIPAVVGMQYTIRDENAIAFSRRFYRALAAGQPIDAAVTDGRLAIFNRSSDDERDWGVPALYLRAEEGVLFPKPVVVEERRTWHDLLELSREQTDRFLREAQGQSYRPGSFIPEVYIHRVDAENKLNAFLDSDASALIVGGDSGVGKTNLLCQWTLDLLAAGHCVFFYDCGGSIRLDIEREVARDLTLGNADELPAALERVGELAAREGRQFVLIFDAINEFQGVNQAGPEALLKRIDALVGRLPDGNTRVVLSVRTSTWRRLKRVGATELFWSRYFQPASGESLLSLDLLTSQELETVYAAYQEFFRLQTPFAELSATVRQRLRVPLLLRMLAEAYQDGHVPTTAKGLTTSIFQRYYEERVRPGRDHLFLDKLVGEMLHQQRSTLPVDELACNERLGSEILSEDAGSSYSRLLDEGILTVTPGDVFQSDLVRFTYDRVGAYAVARHLLRRQGESSGLILNLVQMSEGFPMAWDAARIILLLCKDPATFTTLAQSTDIELRELVVEALVELEAEEPAMTIDLIKQLLQMDSEEARRSGLKAAYYIGPGARDVFLWAATKGTPALRSAAAGSLYLIWLNDPDFTYGLLNELVGRIGLGALLDLRNIFEFIIELSVTIYINHCERPDIVSVTSDLYYELAKNKLHLDLLDTGILGPAFEKLIFRAVASAFSKPILETALGSEVVPPEYFFNLPAGEKSICKRVLSLTDPQADLEPARDDLVKLLEHDVVLCNVLAVMVLAIHAYHDFEATQPLLRSLFEELEARGRLRELLSFTVLLSNTPPEWVGLVEEFTRRLIEESPEIVFGQVSSFLTKFDIVLMPLGLAYGKRGPSMPYFEGLIRDGLSRGDWPLVERCIDGLGPVGFYYPQAVFNTLRAAIPDFSDTHLQEVLVHPLAVMRTLHFDDVDIFLRQIGATESLRRRVSEAADVELVRRYIYWLGIYNNAVHQAVFYPKMRRRFLVEGLSALVDARKPEEAIASFTAIAIHFAREVDYQLSRWTLPE